MKLHKYTIEQLEEAIKTSTSRRQVLTKISVTPYGGNYITLNKAIKHFNLDISHFTGRGWSKDKTFVPKRPVEDYLSNNHSIKSFKLKKRLIKEGLLEPVCDCCKLDTWLDEPIPLELHHKDGNRCNNNLENISLLCPNCHTLTPNYRGKAKHKA